MSKTSTLTEENIQELVETVVKTCASSSTGSKAAAAAETSNGTGGLYDALSELCSHKFTNLQASRLRLAGFCSCLVQLLDPGWEQPVNARAAALATALSRTGDTSTRDVLAREGAPRKLFRLLDRPPEEEACLPATTLLYLLVRAPTESRRVIEEMFRSGGMAKVTRLLGPATEAEPIAEPATQLLRYVANINSSSYRERLRDLGVIDLMLGLVRVRPLHIRTSVLYNMARSESVHTSFKESDFLAVVRQLLLAVPTTAPSPPNGPSALNDASRLSCVLAVAHVYGNEDNEDVRRTLAGEDPSRTLVELLDAVLHSGGSYRGNIWGAEEVLHGVQALARSRAHAAAMVKAHIPAMLVEVLSTSSAPWASDADVALKGVRALLNLTAHPDVAEAMAQNLDPKQGLVAVLERFACHEDMRVADAASGCLRQLREAQEARVQQEAERRETGSMAGAGGGREGGEAVLYDVFLSHKRSDAKDFARALYNLLVLRGISTFLDFEFREELSDLGSIVSRCSNLVFVLTDNVFDSPWCLLELETAVRRGINIVLVVKEGARWKDSEGAKVCEFPPYELINSLPEAIRHVFTRKAVTHSDEYYQSFVELLLAKLVRQAAPDAVKGAQLGSKEGTAVGAHPRELLQPQPHSHQQQQGPQHPHPHLQRPLACGPIAAATPHKAEAGANSQPAVRNDHEPVTPGPGAAAGSVGASSGGSGSGGGDGSNGSHWAEPPPAAASASHTAVGYENRLGGWPTTMLVSSPWWAGALPPPLPPHASFTWPAAYPPAVGAGAGAGGGGAVAAVAAAAQGTAAAVEALQAEVQQLRREVGGVQRETRAIRDAATDSAGDVAELRQVLAAHTRATSHSLMGLTAAVAGLEVQLQRATRLMEAALAAASHGATAAAVAEVKGASGMAAGAVAGSAARGEGEWAHFTERGVMPGPALGGGCDGSPQYGMPCVVSSSQSSSGGGGGGGEVANGGGGSGSGSGGGFTGGTAPLPRIGGTSWGGLGLAGRAVGKGNAGLHRPR